MKCTKNLPSDKFVLNFYIYAIAWWKDFITQRNIAMYPVIQRYILVYIAWWIYLIMQLFRLSVFYYTNLVMIVIFLFYDNMIMNFQSFSSRKRCCLVENVGFCNQIWVSDTVTFSFKRVTRQYTQPIQNIQYIWLDSKVRSNVLSFKT